jgi:hypothetical protein
MSPTETTYAQLRRDVDHVALFARTLLALLEEKGVATEEQFQEALRKLAAPTTAVSSPTEIVRVVDDSNSDEPKWTTEGGYPIYHGSVLSCRFLARPNDKWMPVLNSDGYPCGWNGTMVIDPDDVDKPVFFK